MSTEAVVWAIHQRGMKPSEWRVLVMLADRAGKDNHECWPSYNRIASDCEISRRNAINSVSKLEKQGYLHIIKRLDDAGDSTSNIFRLRVGVKIEQVKGGADSAPPKKAKASGGGAESAPPSAEPAPQVVQIFHQGGADSAPKPYNLTISTEPSLSHSTGVINKKGPDEESTNGERDNPISIEKPKDKLDGGASPQPRANEKPPEPKSTDGGAKHEVEAEPSRTEQHSSSSVGEPPHYGVDMPLSGQPFVPPAWVIPDLWQTWVEQRRSLRSYTEGQKALHCKALGRLITDGWEQGEILENSICLGKDRLYPPCLPGQERQTLAARAEQSANDKPTQQNKPVGGGHASGVVDTSAQERRDLAQEIKGFSDRLKLTPEGSKAYEGLQGIIRNAQAKLDGMG